MNWREWIDSIPKPDFGALLSVLAIIVGTLILWAFIKRAAYRARRRFDSVTEQSSLDSKTALAAAQRLTALQLVVNSARYLLFGAATLIIFSRLNLVKSDSLLFPAGFLGAALGLGAQNLVRDVVAGVFIVFESQFAVDDWVKINGITGRVEEVGLRVTRLRDESSQIHFFPNGAISTVARFPREAQKLILWVPLAAENRDEKRLQAIEQSIEDFRAVHDAWSDKAWRTDDQSGYVRFVLPVMSEQAAAVREKLPARLNAALESLDAKSKTGATVELTVAPVATSEIAI